MLQHIMHRQKGLDWKKEVSGCFTLTALNQGTFPRASVEML